MTIFFVLFSIFPGEKKFSVAKACEVMLKFLVAWKMEREKKNNSVYTHM